jgi:hypothetical protein
MSNPYVSRALYGVLAILGAGVTALIPLLLSGSVPIPKEWVWATPVVIAMLIALAALLPKGGHEEISAQVDALVGKPDARGNIIRHRDLTVVTKDEAIDAISDAPDNQIGRTDE